MASLLAKFERDEISYTLTLSSMTNEYEQDFDNYEDILTFLESCPLDGYFQIKTSSNVVVFVPRELVLEIKIRLNYIKSV